MENINKDGWVRNNIKVGQRVEIVLKKDQRSGILTEGIVKRLLTKSANHTHGIKVELESGDIGRVKISYWNDLGFDFIIVLHCL